MAGEIHVGDVGTEFIATLKNPEGDVIPLGGATGLKMFFERPDATVVEKTAVLYTDGTDGKIKYVAIAGDLNADGSWRVQGKVTIGAWTGRSDIYAFVVRANLNVAP